MTRTRRLLTGLAAAALLLSPALPAHAADGPNTYSLSGLSTTLRTPTKVTLVVAGTAKVCAVDAAGVHDSAAPWQFTVDGTSPPTLPVDVTLCSGGTQRVLFALPVPYRVSTRFLTADSGTRAIKVTNSTGQAAAAVLVTGSGKVLAKASVPAGASGKVRVNTARVPANTPLTLVVDGADTTAVRFPVQVAEGWSVFPSLRSAPAPYRACEVVTWSYDPRGARKGASRASVKADIAGALARISAGTSLRFTPVGVADGARLRFTWADLGASAGADGSTTGDVRINRTSPYVADSYAGFGSPSGVKAGRGWILAHEVLHTMGLAHVADSRQIMNPTIRVARFGSGDLAGMRALYPRGRC